MSEPDPDALDLDQVAKLRELCEGDPAMLAHLVDEHAKDAAKLVADLVASLGARDTKRTEAVAHALKGTSALFGQRALAAVAAELEALAKGGSAPDEDPWISRVERAHGEGHDALERWLRH
jgi:HPt (histidine-containing phosphotransfer) domain-containing protein